MGDIKSAGMLLSEFFPRLQVRALERYDVDLSERQFRDWRERGLIPGPAAPRGLGRGRSPERHWPLSAYRRALRICRYKSHGAERISMWWITLWLSGEEVPHEVLRDAFKRELTSARRRSRYLADSGFLRSTGPTSLDRMPMSPVASPLDPIFDLILESPQLGLTPELQRDFLRLSHGDGEPEDDRRVFESLMRPMLGHSITPADLGVQLEEVWRQGHLGEGYRTPGDYVEDVPDWAFDLTREIIETDLMAHRLIGPNGDLMYASLAGAMLFIITSAFTLKAFVNPQRIDQALRHLFAIQDDLRGGQDPKRRLQVAQENLREATEIAPFMKDRDAVAAYYQDLRENGLPKN